MDDFHPFFCDIMVIGVVMQEYYIDELTTDKKYGLYDYLCLKDNTKTLGAINNKYCFHIDIADHTPEHDIMKALIGPYDLYFATYYHKNSDKTEHVMVYFNYLHSEHEAYPSAFQVECVMGIIKDCLRYQVDNETIIKVDIPGAFFEDEQNRVTTDLSGVLDELQNMYDYYQLL